MFALRKKEIIDRSKRLKYFIRLLQDEKRPKDYEATFNNGMKLKLEAGRYARFADGSCVATLGNTSVLSTVVSSAKPNSNNFVPLVVDYRQKAAAAGRIPTNFLRRELGPTEREILTSRLIDRSLRPLFPKDYFYDTQVVCNTLAVDSVHPPETVAVNAASAALAISDVPWNGPVAAVSIGQIDNEVIVNPTRKELQESALNLIITATKNNLVVMMEGNANDLLQQDLLKAIKIGTKEAQNVVRAIESVQKECGRAKREYEKQPVLSEETAEAVKSLTVMKIREILSDYSHDKISRDRAIAKVRQKMLNQLRASDEDVVRLTDCFNGLLRQTFRDLVFETNVRCDGRNLTDLRNIECKVDLFPPLHGSALFQRGQTQVLCTVAFDSPDTALKMDTLTMLTSGVKAKNFFLHYEFPAYATGEISTGAGRGVGRREAGHGALAEKGLAPLLPLQQECAVRLTAEVLESNGSSSMASVCGGSLALYDAGVEMSSPAAGVAIGLLTRPNGDDTEGHHKHLADYRILTDILGIEDYLGDMDFKLAGSKKGTTALQCDVKVPGISLKIIMESVMQACEAKSKIIDIMNKCIDKPRRVRKENMPITEKLTIEPHQRAKLLGIGGTNLKKIYLETGVQVSSIDETTFNVFAPCETALDEAKERLSAILDARNEPTLEFGAIYKAKVVEVKEVGVLVTLYPGMTPALVHNTQLDHRKIMHPSALGLEPGSEIQVKYFGRDPVSGQVRLSRKVLISPPPGIVRNLDRS